MRFVTVVVVALVFLVPSLASTASPAGDGNTPSDPVRPSPDRVLPPINIRLAPGGGLIASAQSCTSYYPDESIAQNEQGEVTVGYDIDEKGSPQKITILKSSGIDRLDKATVDCASAWHLPAIMKDGAPVYSTGHQALIRFRLYPPPSAAFAAKHPKVAYPPPLDDPSVTPARQVGRTHDCSQFVRPRAFQPLETTVGYDVEADGTITNVSIVVSSGERYFDDEVVSCVRDHWHDEPALKDGVGVRSPNHEAVVSIYFH